MLDLSDWSRSDTIALLALIASGVSLAIAIGLPVIGFIRSRPRIKLYFRVNYVKGSLKFLAGDGMGHFSWEVDCVNRGRESTVLISPDISEWRFPIRIPFTKLKTKSLEQIGSVAIYSFDAPRSVDPWFPASLPGGEVFTFKQMSSVLQAVAWNRGNYFLSVKCAHNNKRVWIALPHFEAKERR